MDKLIKQITTSSLALVEPWYVESVIFDSTKNQINIYVNVREFASFLCPHCGRAAKRYGFEPDMRTWRHADCFFYPTFVHCRRPRVQCPDCGVQQISAPFERKNSRFTLMFEGYAMLIMADMPRSKAAKLLRCNEKSMTNILSYWVNKADNARSLANVVSLAIDETSFRKHHDYVTLGIDADKRCVIDVEKGKGKEAVEGIAKKLVSKGGKTENIKSITSDMSQPFEAAIQQIFPNAEHVVDKFHVKQVVINAMETVRKQEQKDTQEKKVLFGSRHLFWIPKKEMTPEQVFEVSRLSKLFPKTGRAFRIVAALDAFYESLNMDEAERSFKALCSWMRRSRLRPMKEAALTLIRHQTKILAYFKQRLTNAICEGINSLVQTAKRKACGFRTFKGFASMIYLVAGKLTLATPNPFSPFPLNWK